MYSVSGKDIELTRGDTFVLHVAFTGRTVALGSEALFTIKKRVRDTAAVVEKRVDITNNAALIELSATDTDIQPGTYWWDLRVLTGDSVRTPMVYAAFQVLEVIGNG